MPPALVQEVMAMDALCAIPVSLWIVSHFETLPVCVQGNQVIDSWSSIFNPLLSFNQAHCEMLGIRCNFFPWRLYTV